MVEFVDIGIILAGLGLAFFGAALSSYSVTLMGFLIGAGGGYLIAPDILAIVGTATGLVAVATVALIVGAIGAAIAYSTLAFAVAVPGFLVGAFLGRYLVTPLMEWGMILGIVAAVGGGIIGAWVGVVMTRTGLIVISSFFGAALASRSLTLEQLGVARAELALEPVLFDPLSPLFLGLFILGVLAQFGWFKFGYVTKLWAVVPSLRRGARESED